MIDVDIRNFDESLVRQVCESLTSDETEFVSFDLEMSGIQCKGGLQAEPYDTVTTRFLKVRGAASQFTIMQFGLTIFKKSVEGTRQEETYCFYLFPRALKLTNDQNLNQDFLISAASMAFHARNGFDFNRWVSHGIGFVNRQEHSVVHSTSNGVDTASNQEELWSKYLVIPAGSLEPAVFAGDWSVYGSLSGRSTGELEEAYAGFQNFMAEFRQTECSSVGLSKSPFFAIPVLSGGLLTVKAFLSRAKAEYPELCIFELLSGGGTGFPERVVTPLRRTDAVRRLTGFFDIWDALLKCGKPIVLHNGFLDILFAYQCFEDDLPKTIGEVRTRMTAKGARFYDTRLLAVESGVLSPAQIASGTSLSALNELYQGHPHYMATDSGDGIGYDESQFHNAGFDSLITGRVFACLSHDILNFKGNLHYSSDSIHQELDGWRNQIAVTRCLFHFCLEGDFESRPASDSQCQPETKKLYRVLTGIPSSFTARQILNVFQHVNDLIASNVVQAQGVPYIANPVYVSWLQDTSAVLRIQYSGVDPALETTINAELLECVKEHNQSNKLDQSTQGTDSIQQFPVLRLGTVAEYLKRAAEAQQLELQMMELSAKGLGLNETAIGNIALHSAFA